jgi:hypothetical protein
MGAKAMKIIQDLAIFRPASLRRSTDVALIVLVSLKMLLSRKREYSWV